MSNFVGEVSDYIELEGVRLAESDAALLRAFAHGNRKDMEQELLAVYPAPDPTDPKAAARVKASVQRQLQKWGLTGKRGKKVVRGPLAKEGGKLSKVSRNRLRIVLLRRRDAPTRITISGTVCYRSGDHEHCKHYHSTVEPVGERALLDILKLADVSTRSASGVEPPAGGSERGEEAACNVLTGYWFEQDPQDITCDGKVVIHQPYHDVMRYTDAVVFHIERIGKGKRSAA